MTGNFDKQHLKGDIFGGITAGVVAIPLALAFGVSSGLGAIYGLYGAFALGIVAALLGGTACQVSGPTGPMTVVSATVVAAALATFGNLESAWGLIIACFLMAGLFQILMGFLGLGRYIRYIPYPVLSGFMSGIGAIIILLQIFPFLGQVSPKGTVNVLKALPAASASLNWTAALIGAGTIMVIYLFPKITKTVPSALVALVGMTLITTLFKLDVPIIGDVPEGFPAILLGNLSQLGMEHFMLVLKFGAMLAALGAIDSLLTSVVADNITKTRHNSNKELIGQGIGNMVSACIGGLPGAGATMRTVVNVKAGGRTRLSGTIHGILLLALLLGAGPLAEKIPLAVLAGILITVGIGIIDYKGFRQLRHIPRSDAFILVIVFLLTVFWNLLFAVGVGLVAAAVIFMKQSGDLGEQKTKATLLGDFAKGLPWADELDLPDVMYDRVYIKRLHGPLFFGFAFGFKDLVAEMPDVDHVVIRMKRVPFIDQSGAYALEEALVDLRDKGITVALSGLNDVSRDRLMRMSIIPQLVPEDRDFKCFEDCLSWLKSEILNPAE
ncbi:SulP family inorganic anion transporter [Verrucomicrobia bacterium]|jgi:sulfate permease, SulP family|nr:SulP family inorganic anion transporter [Verrucomicrobiota bacterium]